MIKKKGVPKKDELILCTVKRVDPNSAFVSLDEYEKVNGMIHINEVALRGVKNIKSHLKEGKKLVCKVLEVKDNVVDVSLKRVRSGERKEKLNQARTSKRFYHLIEHACKKTGKKGQTDKIAELFIKKYGSIINAYETLKEKGIKFLDGMKFPDKLGPIIKSSFESLLKQLAITIKKQVKVFSKKSDGVERIKKLFASTPKKPGISTSYSYLGSGKFSITIESMNYKTAENYYEILSEAFISKGKELGIMVNLND